MPAYAQLLVIVVAFLIFWAIVMRPARNQQRQMQQLQHELAVGDEVILSAGIFGTIRALDDSRVELEIAPGTVITVARQVVVRRVEEDDATTESDPATESDGREPEGRSSDPGTEN